MREKRVAWEHLLLLSIAKRHLMPVQAKDSDTYRPTFSPHTFTHQSSEFFLFCHSFSVEKQATHLSLSFPCLLFSLHFLIKFSP